MGRVTFNAHNRALIVTGCNFWAFLFLPVMGLFALVFYFHSVWQAFVWLYVIPVTIALAIHAVYMRAGYKQIAGVVEELLPAQVRSDARHFFRE